MDVSERLSFFAALFKVDENPVAGMWELYALIFVLSAVVYKLAFAEKQKLPLLKSFIIYLILALGCTVFTFLGAFLPVAEGLAVATILLLLYRIRNRKTDINKVKG